MSGTLAGLYDRLLANRVIVIVLTLLAVIASGMGTEKLGFSNDYRDFFPADDPNLVAFEALQDNFLRTNNVFIAVEAKSGNMFTPAALDRLTALTEALWDLPFIVRVDSLANHQFIQADDETIAVVDLVTRDAPITADVAAAFRDMALAEVSVNGILASADPAMAGINILIDDDGVTEAGKVELMTALRPLLETQAADVFNTYLTGSIVVDHGFDVAAQADLEVLYAAMYLVALILVGWLTRSVVVTIGVLLTMTFAWCAALGIAAYAGLKLTAISVAAPTVLMTICIAQAMHIVFAIQRNGANTEDRKAAVKAAMLYNARPLFLVALSTGIGFSAIMMSEVPPLSDLGFILTVGVVALFILSMTFLPVYLSYFRMSNERLVARADDQMTRLGRFIGGAPFRPAAVLAALALCLVAAVPLNRINDNFIEYFSADHAIRTDAATINSRLSGVHYVYMQVDARGDSIFDTAYLAELDSFATWLRDVPQVRHVTTYADTQKRLNQALSGDRASAYVVPANSTEGAQLNLLYEMSLPFGLSTENLITPERDASKVTIVLDNVSSDDVLALEARIADWTAANSDAALFQPPTGPMSMFAHIGQRNAQGLITSTFVALLLVSVMLMLALRSVKFGLLSIVPNVLPAAMAFGVWGLVDGQVGLAVSIVAVMTFGIVVDDTVFFMSRFREHVGRSSFTDTVVATLRDTGRPIINTTIILVAGFTILAFSEFRLNQGLGILTAMVMGFALIADLFLLPGLLKLAVGRKDADVTEPATDALKTPAE
ncbi:MAG: MMPL family transporter [Pseudomonadota bacterium]